MSDNGGTAGIGRAQENAAVLPVPLQSLESQLASMDLECLPWVEAH
jgi:hypothetical protein